MRAVQDQKIRIWKSSSLKMKRRMRTVRDPKIRIQEFASQKVKQCKPDKDVRTMDGMDTELRGYQ